MKVFAPGATIPFLTPGSDDEAAIRRASMFPRRWNKIDCTGASANICADVGPTASIGPVTSNTIGYQPVGAQTPKWPIDCFHAGFLQAFGKQRSMHLIHGINSTRCMAIRSNMSKCMRKAVKQYYIYGCLKMLVHSKFRGPYRPMQVRIYFSDTDHAMEQCLKRFKASGFRLPTKDVTMRWQIMHGRIPYGSLQESETRPKHESMSATEGHQ
eukprot:12411377-Karenia_brevis.AAC.1